MKSRTIHALLGLTTIALAGCASMGGPADASHAASGQTQACRAVSEQEILALFDRWNESLRSGDPHKVVANYAEHSILLPTVSNQPRVTAAEKEDYFHHFLENRPSGRIDFHYIQIGCNSAFDAGLYTFTFEKTGAQVHARYTYTYAWDGKQWLITSHHSSAMPENK